MKPPGARALGFYEGADLRAAQWTVMTQEHPERLPVAHRLRTSSEYSQVKSSGTAIRGRHCLVLVLAHPSEPTRIGFIASRRGVGGAVSRNRARRRLREIVRRRWSRIQRHGYWMVFVAGRGTLTADHQSLATEVERLLATAGALNPVAGSERMRPCAPSRFS